MTRRVLLAQTLHMLVATLFMLASGAAAGRHHLTQETRSELQRTFEDIYSNSAWGSAGGGSGGGSTLPATKYTAEVIRVVVNKYGLRSMGDMPCGAMHWMPLLLRDIREDMPGFQYLGVDIALSVIDANKERFQTQSEWMRFEAFDFTKSVPAKTELILCRDALQHLSIVKVIDALESFAGSTARYLLVGSYFKPEKEGGVNTNITDGDYFAINLTLEPFLLTKYQHRYSEHTQELIEEDEKHLLLYSVAYLNRVDFTQMRMRAGIL